MKIKNTVSQFKPYRTAIEKAIAKGRYDLAAGLIEDKKLKNLLVNLDETSPYISIIAETNLQIKLFRFLRQSKKEAKKDKKQSIRFDDITSAMQHVGKTGEEAERIKEEKELRYLEKIRENEAIKYKASQTFYPIPVTQEIGVSYGDVILLAPFTKVALALKEFPEYEVIKLTNQECAIRKVKIVGIRSDRLILPENQFKKRKRYKGWKAKIKREPKFILDQIDGIIHRQMGLKIVTKQVILYSNFYYVLVLPTTIISPPYCDVVSNRIIPIIRHWDILGKS